MVDLVLSVARLLVALFLVLLNGFFVAVEFSFVRVRSTSVEALVEEGTSGAVLLQEAMQNLDDYLAVTQLGITISSLGLGWLGEPAVAALIEPLLKSVLPANAVHFATFAIGFSFITFLHVVFGELAPKTIAIAQAERIALFVAAPMKAFYYLFIPGIIVFNGTANFFTRLVGIPPASESEETLTEEEILTVLSHSQQEGAIDTEEVEMIEHVFDLDDIPVREVMVPRPDVVSVSADLPLAELRSFIIEEGYTRYPVVHEEESDQVIGFVDIKDILHASELDSTETDATTAGDLARDMLVIPETGRIIDLLTQFQTEQRQMAAVIDEWGAFEGIATVEDIIEVIVGDIRDEFDAAGREPSISRRDDETYVVDGGVTLSKVNEELDTAFEIEDFETIGGLVLHRLGRAPDVGDQVVADGYRIEVYHVDGTRVSTVVIQKDNSIDGPGE